jgi:hypothetical protein
MNGPSRLVALGGFACVLLSVAWHVLGAQSRELQSAAPSADPAHDDSDEASDGPDAFAAETLRGKVDWFAEAIKRRYDVRTTEDAKERVLALVSEGGEIHPLIEDSRGRAFRKDERLRNREVELFVRRYQGVPMVQVIRVYTIKPDGRYLVDYWCDVCAISMVEDGPCDCCQAPNELRERKVE